MERAKWLEQLNASLDELHRIHQRRVRREVGRIVEQQPQGSSDQGDDGDTSVLDNVTECFVDGIRCLSFATNDYLGLTQHPAVVAAFQHAASQQFGSGSSPLIAGRTTDMVRLEQQIALFEGTESAIVFPSGFAANFGTLTALIHEGDAIFCERENHASLIDGCRASAGRFFVYDRADLDAMRKAIRRRRADYKSVWIVTDSVFSMDGSIADLSSLCDIAEELEALVVVDEAHGTGVFGEHGRGVCELQDVEHRVAVRIGTLSKAIGGLGGFVAGPTVLCDWLWNRARSQFFSTALPPAVCAAAAVAIQVIHEEPDRRMRLVSRCRFLRTMLRQFGLNVLPAPDNSPIVGVLIGSDEHAVAASAQMLDAGVFTPAVRPPTVPSGTARLRFSLTSEHTEAQLRHAAHQLRDVLAAFQ